MSLDIIANVDRLHANRDHAGREAAETEVEEKRTLVGNITWRGHDAVAGWMLVS